MDVQIFGLKKSSVTRKAERFFKERRIFVHFVDLLDRPIAKGELGRFVQKEKSLQNLLDTSSKSYSKLGLEYMRLSEERLIEHIQEHPDLLILPLVRFGKHLSIGDAETQWRTWLAKDALP
ncbi:MAG: ArsC/Spx/MgsR family protein [Deinococcaceae bacterium]